MVKKWAVGVVGWSARVDSASEKKKMCKACIYIMKDVAVQVCVIFS